MNSNDIHPVSGIYEPHRLQKLFYGVDCVKLHLISALPSSTSRVFIVTGNSLAKKTPLIKIVEALLGPTRHIGTFSGICQHAQSEQVAQAEKQLLDDPTASVIIGIGGGSPIDAAKTLSYRFQAAHGRYLLHVAIPTTLSAAECTDVGGTTMPDGIKQGVRNTNLAPQFIFYDPSFALYTPPRLFMSTGIRAMDHAIELQYNQAATWLPCKAMALQSITSLAHLLPQYKSDPTDTTVIIGLFLAAYGSLGFFGNQMQGSLGLSHTIGYALGSPYSIPHGITSCLTLGHVVGLKARLSAGDAQSIANTLPCFGVELSGDNVADSFEVGRQILHLIGRLGLQTTLTEYSVGKDQLGIICERALGTWMPGEEKESTTATDLREAVRSLVSSLF